jgi:hypothetical protein
VSGKHHYVEASDSIYLVQWQGKAFPLQEPTVLENCGAIPMPVGTMVARGFYWRKVIGKGSEDWFERPQNYDNVKVFWTRHVLNGKVTADKPSAETGKPPKLTHLQFYNANLEKQSLCRKVVGQEWTDLLFEKHVREKMQIVEVESAHEEEAEEVKEKREAAAKEKAKADEEYRKDLKMQSLLCNRTQAPKQKKKPKPKDKSTQPAFAHGKMKPTGARRKKR